MRVSVTVMALLGLLVFGCTQPEVLLIGTPRPASERVEVLLDEPTREYETIALVRIPSTTLSLAKQRELVVREAKAVGGEAVIITMDDNSMLVPIGGLWMESKNKLLIGKVIVFK